MGESIMDIEAVSPSSFQEIDRVVIVEDEKDVVETLEQVLQKRGLHVDSCDSLATVRDVARSLDMAMFVVDIDLGPGRRTEGLAGC